MSANLFKSIQVGSLQLANRVFLPPFTRCRADINHVPNDLMKEYYTQRASAGLLIAESSLIAAKTKAVDGQPGAFTQEQLLGWKNITHAVHAKGGKIFLQLWHPGRFAHPDNNDGQESVAPSPIAIEGETHTPHGMKKHAVPRELTVDEIKELVQLYATVAANSIQVAGFDGVEIHGANACLIDQFLRSSSNIRTDAYGGSVENRTRFLSEVLQAVTDAIGADKVGLRVSPLNSLMSMKDEDPIRLSEHVAKVAQRFNLAYVHVIRRDHLGLQTGDVLTPIRKHFHNALIANMGGEVDAVSFGALFMANPDLPERFAKDAELNPLDLATIYAGGANGYTDYPTLTQP
ncbi:hypothetical protein AeMF1_018872 [Aphanomyces euteiches]|nr:hypothetical protein AeMF1_018872 [Aphanomyces euteiches]